MSKPTVQMNILHQERASIDNLATTKSLIDLSQRSGYDFDIFPDQYELTSIFDDTVLVEYIDETKKGDILRDGIVIPENMAPKAWRKAVVVLAGMSVRQCKVGDIVVFPNDLGMAVSNLEVTGYGRLHKGIFLSENRLFGVCKKQNGSKSTNS